MENIFFKVEGIPVAKGRARVTSRGGFARAYTPAKTVQAEKVIADAGRLLMETNQLKPFDCAIRISLIFHMPIPKSTSKADRKLIEDGLLHHTKKPDADNLAKLVLDSLNGICYIDDSQCVRLMIEKRYNNDPSTFIRIKATLLEPDL